MNYLPEGVNPAPASPPRDYKVMEMDIGHGLKTKVMVCKKCGCPVMLVRVHNDWHAANDRPQRVRTRKT